MAPSPFVHLEVLGPRASVDGWLQVLQDHGGCHVVDALHGLEGEAGIGRPMPTPDERGGETLRSEAAGVLRAVERVLPPTAADTRPEDRPAWAIGALGEGRVDLEQLVAEAREVGGRLQRALEAAREASTHAETAEADALAVRALTARGERDLSGWLAAFPTGSARAASRIRRFLKGARRRGAYAARADGASQAVVAVRADASLDTWLEEEAAAAAARRFTLPEALRAVDADPSAEAVLDERRAADEQALAALRAALTSDGPRARALLDALEDAEARSVLRGRLAATRHVAAARAWVQREEQPELERRLERAFGPEVVVRHLAASGDEPVLPRAVAGVPFAALEGLWPSRFGSMSSAALLALVVPIATAAALSDMAAGLFFLIVGGLLGAGAPPGSPRRDTALLGQVAGVVSFLLGMGGGSIAGRAGFRLFGTGWGLVGDGAWAWEMDAYRTFVLVLGGAAFLLALWGGASALRALARGDRLRARTAGIVAGTCLVVAGVAGLGGVTGSLLRWAWVLGPVGAGIVILLMGLGAGIWRLLLVGVGVFRLAAVGYLAIWAYEIAFAVLARPSLEHFALGPALLLVATLAAIVDPAHVAMGVPYDLSLSGRGLAEPFAPFRRRIARGSRDGEEAA